MRRELRLGLEGAGMLLLLPLFCFTQWTWLNPKLTSNRLNDVVFIDSLNGIIAGNNGTLITTDDGGEEWIVNIPETGNDLTCIFMVNQSVIYIAGVAGIIMKTTNSGGYWRTLDSGFPLRINDIWFTSVDTGYAVGMAGAVMRTTDGAES